MNYLPSSDQNALAWMLNFAALITTAPATYGLTGPDAVIIDAQAAAFDAALTLSSDPATRTSPTVAAKDAAKASAEFIMRPYAVGISLNPSVTNEAKVAVGVTVRSNTPTPIPAPVTPPVIALVKAQPLTQQINITPVGFLGKAKPAGCIAIEVARSVGTVAATDPSQLTVVGQYGKTPLIQNFVAADQGKIVTYAARYRTRSGPAGVSQAGPWSALLSLNVM